MATTYISIDATNYRWFGLAAVILGVLGFVCIIFFDRTKRLHVVEILQVSANGSALLDQDGEPVAKSVVVGREDQLRSEAAAALKTARRRGGVSLKQFMSGYEIGRASCRARVCQSVSRSVVAGTLKKK